MQASHASFAARPLPPALDRGAFQVERGAAPHRHRGRLLLKAHPELRALVGPAPITAAWIAAAGTVQLASAVLLAGAPAWAILLAAYGVGAVLSLALWTLLHETSHDLVFRSPAANRLAGILCGLALGLPVATSFRTYHLLHHRHHGDRLLDADVPSDWEARWVGCYPLRKALWLLGLPVIQSLRALRIKEVTFLDRWQVLTLALQAVFTVALVAAAGWGALVYLLLSTCFSIGLHPLGGRWIQEHYLVREDQETYSYYGPMNALVFNAGFHHEHHDLMRVPWMHLPAVRRIAREHYSHLHAHRSWTALLFAFLFNRNLTLLSRAVRPAQDAHGKAKP